MQFGTREIGKLDNAFKRGGINGFATQLGTSLGNALQMLIKQTPKFGKAAGNFTERLDYSVTFCYNSMEYILCMTPP